MESISLGKALCLHPLLFIIILLQKIAKSLNQEDNLNFDREYFKIVGALTQDWVMNSKFNSVRLLCACCLTECIKSFAPNDPFPYEDLKAKVLSFFSSIFADGLSAKEKHAKRIDYMLKSFDKIKVSSIFCDVDEVELLSQFLHSILDLLK